MARYRVLSNKLRGRDSYCYVSGTRTEHMWSLRRTADTFTPLQAIKKCAHVNHLTRGDREGPAIFEIEVVDDA